MSRKKCELCEAEAKTYCESDRARLCWECDGRVHGANFLVAKHSRSLLCRLCHSPTPWTASGPSLSPTVSLCRSCLHNCCNKPPQNQHHQHYNDHDHDHDIDYDDDRDHDGQRADEHDLDRDDDDDEDEDCSEDDDDEENQVVPWSNPTTHHHPVSFSSRGGFS